MVEGCLILELEPSVDVFDVVSSTVSLVMLFIDITVVKLTSFKQEMIEESLMPL